LNENTLRSKAHRALKKVKNLIDLEKRGLKWIKKIILRSLYSNKN
jgi:hypothetical protein